jgi:endonuclease/exonuclease/phosphatase family metal-dependent hydrolase
MARCIVSRILLGVACNLILLFSIALSQGPLLGPGMSCGKARLDDENGVSDVIEWKSSPAPAAKRKNRAWCRGVGSPLILTTNARIRPVDSIVVVVWNIQVGGGDLARFIGDLRDGGFTKGRPAADFVLLLQEVFRSGEGVPESLPPNSRSGKLVHKSPPSGNRMDIHEVARQEGLSLFYVPSMRNGSIPEDRGNAILSTLPLSRFTAVELPLERQRRVAVGARISGVTSSGKFWKLQLINVHLENRSGGSGWHRSFGKGRLKQARAVVQAFEDADAAVLGGDLNTWNGGFREPAVQYIQKFYALPHEGSSEGTIKSWFLWPAKVVDYMFFKIPSGWKAGYRCVDDTYGSDHYPLLGKVFFKLPVASNPYILGSIACIPLGGETWPWAR